jgi:hypothetical protein
MDETRDRIDGWDSRPVEDRAALRRLADRGFTGAVVDGDAIIFLLNGRAVGSAGRGVDGFDGGTARDAPDPSLPLLFAMQATGGETWTRGYTNDTPLREVDETLQSSNFTGYVELSEKVLSGEYYMIYYGGQPLYAAFVGPDGERLTGEEAFERAADEVGIYEVIEVDLEVSDVPESESDSDAETAAAATAADDGGEAAAGAAGAAAGGSEEPDAESESGSASDGVAAEETATEESGVEGAPPDESAIGSETTATDTEQEVSAPARGSEAEGETDPDADVDSDPEPEPGAAPDPEADDGGDAAESGVDPDARGQSEGETEAGTGTETEAAEERWPAHADEEEAGEAPTGAGEESDAEPDPTGASSGAESDDAAAAEPTDAAADAGSDSGATDDGVFAEEEEWRKTTAIPALSPDETETGGSDAGTGTDADGWPRPDEAGHRDRSGSRQSSAGTGDRTESETEFREELESRARELEAARERIESATAELESEREARERLEAELSDLREEREGLRERVETLEAELAETRAESGAGGESEPEASTEARSIDPERALAETDLFVRYGSQGEPTLGAVTDGADREAVTANLRFENHTQFDAGGVTVEGVPFEEFLQSTLEYRFVRWAVIELPFEIREAGRESELVDLYGVLSDVDRAELHGAIEVEPGPEGGAERREFDVVLRDRMGSPLIVADVSARRDPVTGEMMDELVNAAAAVEVESDDGIGAALYVTESFFAPDALEAAEEVTGGGFLSRSSKESYVRTDRKRGFHLCLVESREDAFYVTVPEL